MNEEQTPQESNPYVLFQSVHIDLSNLESKELINCSTDLYLTVDGREDLSNAISLHFRQGIVSAVRYLILFYQNFLNTIFTLHND